MNRSQELLDKYLKGQCSLEEKKQLYELLRYSEAHEFDEVLQSLWHDLSEAPAAEKATSERMFKAITHHIEKEDSKVVPLRRSPLLVAASLTGLLLLCTLGYFIYLNTPQTFSTAYGQVKTLTLPDQTVVHLNANSTLSYARTYATDAVREVWLEGEAYFEVTKQVRPTAIGLDTVKLIVHTEQIDVVVTGTAFNVKNRRGTTQVVLDEGKVHLKKPEKQERILAMQPGETVSINQQQQYAVKRVEEPETYSSWKQNELYFDDKTLGEVQQVLADNYGIKLRFADPALQQLRFTGSTPADDLSMLMTTLEKSFSLTITQNHDEYTVIRNQP